MHYVLLAIVLKVTPSIVHRDQKLLHLERPRERYRAVLLRKRYVWTTSCAYNVQITIVAEVNSCPGICNISHLFDFLRLQDI